MNILPDADKLPAKSLATHIDSAWQAQRAHVANHSGFYQALWGDLAPPENIRDIAGLPLSDKSQLRQAQATHPPFGNYLATPLQIVNRLHRTSGTTGQAMNLALSSRDTRITRTIGGRSQRAAGLGPAHTVVHCLNYQMWMGGLTDHLTLEATGALVVPFGVGNTELLIRTIREAGINAISCTPSYPAVLERVLTEKFPGVQPSDLGLELGLFGGEPGLDDPAFRARLQDTWGMEPRNANYGVSDVLSNFAAQCTLDNRLHFTAADALYPELINPDTGDVLPLAATQRGELVLTHLIRDCQPLVRFRSGDIIEINETEPCRCGRTGFRFSVVGRTDDMVVVRGLNLFPTMVSAVISQFGELSGEYRIELDTPPPHDYLPVTVELADSANPDIRQNTGPLATRIEQSIKEKLGARAVITVKPAGSFPRTEGKTRRVIKNLP